MSYLKVSRIGILLIIFTLLFSCESSSQNSLVKSEESVRIADWKEDLMFLKNKFEKEHYNLFRVMSKKEWEAKFSILLNEIPNLNDHEVITETMKIISLVGDGHSSLYLPFKGKHQFHQVPISFYEFEDGVYIKGAAPQYKDLVGLKVLKIGNTLISEIKERLKLITNRDNDVWIQVLGMEIYMTIPEILYSLKITNSITKIELELEDENKNTVKSEVKAGLFDIASARFISVRPDWISARNINNKLPLYLKKTTNFPNDFYWFEHLKTINAVYFQLNVVFNKPDENLDVFCDKMFKYIDLNNIENLIIDIRLNSGGNNQLNNSIISSILKASKINKKGNLFVIVGRRTFSAAMNLATNLEQKTNAIFVGENTGSSPNFVGEDNRFTLPKNGLFFSASNKYWQDSSPDDRRKYIKPQIYNSININDYKNNIDPNINSIIEYIKNDTLEK